MRIVWDILTANGIPGFNVTVNAPVSDSVLKQARFIGIVNHNSLVSLLTEQQLKTLQSKFNYKRCYAYTLKIHHKQTRPNYMEYYDVWCMFMFEYINGVWRFCPIKIISITL